MQTKSRACLVDGSREHSSEPQEKIKRNTPMNMNALLNTDSISEAFAPAETSPFDAATTEAATSITQTIDSTCVRTLGHYTREVLQGIGWIFAALYLVGASALGAIILYHTFVH
jgi:hypothetical protein